MTPRRFPAGQGKVDRKDYSKQPQGLSTIQTTQTFKHIKLPILTNHRQDRDFKMFQTTSLYLKMKINTGPFHHPIKFEVKPVYKITQKVMWGFGLHFQTTYWNRRLHIGGVPEDLLKVVLGQ